MFAAELAAAWRFSRVNRRGDIPESVQAQAGCPGVAASSPISLARAEVGPLATAGTAEIAVRFELSDFESSGSIRDLIRDCNLQSALAKAAFFNERCRATSVIPLPLAAEGESGNPRLMRS